MSFSNIVLLVVFVQNFNELFDSTNAMKGKTELTDLMDTLQYKLLTLCSNVYKVNKKSVKQTAWIQETCSV